MCGILNVWVCVCAGFVMCVCVCVGFVICWSVYVYVWDFKCVGCVYAWVV